MPSPPSCKVADGSVRAIEAKLSERTTEAEAVSRKSMNVWPPASVSGPSSSFQWTAFCPLVVLLKELFSRRIRLPRDTIGVSSPMRLVTASALGLTSICRTLFRREKAATLT